MQSKLKTRWQLNLLGSMPYIISTHEGLQPLELAIVCDS